MSIETVKAASHIASQCFAVSARHIFDALEQYGESYQAAEIRTVLRTIEDAFTHIDKLVLHLPVKRPKTGG